MAWAGLSVVNHMLNTFQVLEDAPVTVITAFRDSTDDYLVGSDPPPNP